jgi:ferrous-iron efflux pump FieF
MTETHSPQNSISAALHGPPAALMRLATVAAVTSAVLLTGFKTWAYFDTHSVALLSSLADSALDLMASALNFMAVRLALTPADNQHRFGHGKAEPLSALGQAAFVAGSGVLVIVESISRFSAPAVVPNPDLGIIISLLSVAVTVALVTLQRYVVRRTASLAIGADALHYTGDILLNGSVIVALILSSKFGFTWADPVFGIGISIFMVVNALTIANQAISALMDRELPEAERSEILRLARHHPKVRHVHELRTRSSGLQKFIQMHVVLDHRMSLLDAHRITDDVEKTIEAAFPGADIIIHQDPEGIVEFHPPVGGPLH